MKNLNPKILYAIAVALSACAKPQLPTSEVYQFPGVDDVKINDDGSVILSWEKVPSKDTIKYGIFKREASETFNWAKPLEIIATETYKISPFPIDQKLCFGVRYFIVGLDEDVNTKEACPELPIISGFIGIDTATSTDTGTATVTWKKPTAGMDDIVGYRVYSGTDFKTQVASTDARNSQVVVTGLTADSSVTLGVRAFDKYGREDSNTRTVSVDVVNNALPVFGGVDTLTQESASSIKISWAAADIKPAKYNIYKATGTANTTLAVSTATAFTNVSAATYSKIVASLGDEQAHCFAVKAETSGGQKDQNTIVKCLTLPDNGAPVFSGIKSLTFASGGAAISWDEAIGQTTSYKVYYQQGTSLDFNTASVTTITAPATGANITGLADNRSWTFAVRAVDSHNNYDSNSVTMTATAGDLTPPTFVGYVSSVALSETSIQLVFQRSVDTDTNRYDIKIRQTSVGGAYTKVAEASQVSSGNITTTLTGLLPATSYDLLVTALDTSGNPSTNSAYLTRATLDLTAPNFGGVTSAAKKSTDATKMMVYWNAAIDTGGLFEYRVFYSTQSLIGKTLVRSATYPLVDGAQTIYMSNSVSNSATSVELSGLSASTTYYFVVHAVDTAGNEDSNTIQATATMPNFTAPAAVTGLSFNPAPGAATINRVPFVNGSGVVGNTAFVYVDGVAAGSQTISAGGTFSIQLSLPNTSKVYVVTATQKNIDGVESNSTSVGNYNLQVDPPTATISGAPTEASSTSTAAIVVTVAGANVANYKWAMTGSGSDCNSASRSALTAVATNISHTVSSDGNWKLCVWGYDNLGNEQTTATSRTWILDSVAPSVAATLTGAPTGNSASTNVSVTVGGTDIVRYKYVFTTQATACTSGGLTYSNFTPIATLITGNPGSDGNIRLCVKGYDAAANAAPESNADWVKITAPPTISALTLADKTTASTTMTNTQVINATVTGSATLSQGCFKTTNSVPGAGDSCWGATTQQVTLANSPVTVGTGVSNTVYAWARDALGNIQTTATSASITWTNYCDSGTFDGTCSITATRTIPNGTKLGGTGQLIMTATGIFNMSATQSATITLGGNLTIENGGAINGNYTITAVNLNINSGGSLNATGFGFAGGGAGSIGGGTSPGLGSGGAGGGGSHAGLGAATSGGTAGGATTYGSATQPVTFGSGGGGGNTSWGIAGSAGGGAIKLILSGTLTVDGTLTANGANSTSAGGGGAGGSGAGGSLWIAAADMEGGGTISAKGGTTPASTGIAGAGGGGRIAIYNSARPFHGIISVAGGVYAPLTTDLYAGGVGTLYIDSSVGICDTGTLSSTCTITGNVVLPNGSSITGSGNLVVASGATLQVLNPTDTISVSMTGNVTINGTVNANINPLSAANVTVAASGSLNANGVGHNGGKPAANGSGTGGGVYSSNYGGGGGHAGSGGLGGSGSSSGGSIYGSTSNPSTMGSGGGGSNCALGGNGGGIIKIAAAGLLIVDGTLSANGMPGSNKSAACYLSGSGAGGTLHITTGTISGSGTIEAKGGTQTVNGVGGGGGGGYIYLSSSTPFSGAGVGAVTVAGGTSRVYADTFYVSDGTSGSVVYGQTPCSSGTPATTCYVNQAMLLPNNTTLTGTGNLILQNGATLWTASEQKGALNFSGDITLQSGSTIAANLSLLQATNVNINSGASINVNGIGFQSNPNYLLGGGTGGGRPVTWTSCPDGSRGGGGSHGGNGGGGNAPGGLGVNFTTYYGSKLNPTTFGSAGGGNGSTIAGNAGNGGGVVKIVASGTVTVAGTISANGTTGTSSAGGIPPGAGAGGSIWIVTNTLAGSANISANGASGFSGCTSGYLGGGGAGGRIALEYSSTTYSGSSTVTQGSGGHTTAAGVGSICVNGAGAGCIN